MLFKNISPYLNNNSYNINITKNNIYINNYNKINQITENTISLNTIENTIYITGNNFKVLRMLDKEILFNGQINTIEIKDI